MDLQDLTQAGARAKEAAVQALERMAMSRNATPAEREKAEEDIAEIEREWEANVRADFAGRTAQLRVLVERLEAITAAIVTDPLKPIKDELNRVIDDAKETLRTATEDA